MDTSPKLPILAKYYYVSQDHQIRSPEFTIEKDLWTIVRYNLETYKGAFVNNRTYLRGFDSKFQELVENLPVPDVFYVHRETLLPGMRPYQPALTHPKYLSYRAQYDQLQDQYYSCKDKQELLKKSDKLFATIKSFEAHEGFHSSKLHVYSKNISKEPTIEYIAKFAVPPKGYLCKRCNEDHFTENCENAILMQVQVPKFGADKMKPLSVGPNVGT